MQLARVVVQNIKGVEYQEFAAGALTVLRGPNGVGKSSILDAIRTVFEGGHSPELIRQGAKKGEVVLTLDDGTTITKSITTKGQTTTVKTAEGAVVPAPATFIQQLAKGFAFDPLAFVHAPHKERADYLSKLMPIEITKAQIVAAVENRKVAPQIEKFLNAPVYDIGKLTEQRKRIYDDRVGTNRTVKTLEGTIDTLKKQLPANWEPEATPESVLQEPRTKVVAAQGVLLDAKHMRDKALAEVDSAHRANMAEVNKWESEEIDKIRVQATEKRVALESEYYTCQKATSANFQYEIESAQSALTEAENALAAAKERAKSFEAQAQASAAIKQYRSDLTDAIAEADMYTAAIDAIDAAKEAALKKSPIPGLSVIDGEVMYQPEGLDAPIPFDQVNTQLQYRIALKIAAMGAGTLGLMVLDNTEAMDETNWSEFKQAVVDSGFQIIAARVDNIQQLDIEPISA